VAAAATLVDDSASVTSTDVTLLDAYSRSVTSVVDEVGPAVVSLSIRGKRSLARRRRNAPTGAGSGVLIAPDGYVLTNSHVIAAGGKITVAMSDGADLPARVVGDDPATDLALLHVEGSRLPFAQLGELKAQPGQLAIAMGNPLGFASTVSTGVVSALGRSLRGRRGRLIEDVVQHTAPLNPGSSGGPLLDSAGHILGINTAIIAWSQGIGFAVPATTASWVVGELMARGRVRRAWLGVGGQVRRLPRKDVRRHNLEQASAVEVASIQRGGPASSADVIKGDLIVRFEGTGVADIDALHRILRDHTPGAPATIDILRKGELLRVRIDPRELAD
jgi:S1-C subfamily serine protease